MTTHLNNTLERTAKYKHRNKNVKDLSVTIQSSVQIYLFSSFKLNILSKMDY